MFFVVRFGTIGDFVSSLFGGIELHRLVVVEFDSVFESCGCEAVVAYGNVFNRVAVRIFDGDGNFNALVGVVGCGCDRKGDGGIDARGRGNAADRKRGCGSIGDFVLNLYFVSFLKVLRAVVKRCDVLNKGRAVSLEFIAVRNVGDFRACGRGDFNRRALIRNPLAVFVIKTDFCFGENYGFTLFHDGRDIGFGNAKLELVVERGKHLIGVGNAVCIFIFDNIVTEHSCMVLAVCFGVVGFARRVGNSNGNTASRRSRNGKLGAVLYGLCGRFGSAESYTRRFYPNGSRRRICRGNVAEAADRESHYERKRTKSCK